METLNAAAQAYNSAGTLKNAIPEIRTEGKVLFNMPTLAHQLASGLERRRISVIANNEPYYRLHTILTESALFNKNNINQVDPGNLDSLKDNDLILLDYASIYKQDLSAVQNKLEELLSHKSSKAGLIVYCNPADLDAEGKSMHIETSLYQKLANLFNTVVVQQTGRLLSDILLMMLTTAPSRVKG